MRCSMGALHMRMADHEYGEDTFREPAPIYPLQKWHTLGGAFGPPKDW